MNSIVVRLPILASKNFSDFSNDGISTLSVDLSILSFILSLSIGEGASRGHGG